MEFRGRIAHPERQDGALDVDTLREQHLGLPIEREVPGIFGDQHKGDHRLGRQAAPSHHAVPAIYSLPVFVEVGGLMSYGADLAHAYQHAGIYVGKILRGAKPADLPIQQSIKFELVINVTTAKTLGLTVPPSLLACADDVIE